MLHLSTEYRQLVWNRSDWSDVLVEMGFALRERSGSSAEFAELAELSSAIVPDASVAMELYCRAYATGADDRWAEEASRLALQLGDFASVARVADLRHGYTGEARFLRDQALGLLDAGLIDVAREPLRRAAELLSDDAELGLVQDAVSGRTKKLSASIEDLSARAREAESSGQRSSLLLCAARIAGLRREEAQWEDLLLQAFEADPQAANPPALLENAWIERHEWRRLNDLYRLKAEQAPTSLARVQALRRAGTRLILRSESPATGVRLLQQAVSIVYKEQLETLPELVALLGLLTEVLVHTGGAPSAIRVLAHGLAHPRTDDEAMWILNRGLELARNDLALRRTIDSFEMLRERLLSEEPALLEADAATDIGFEVSERENPPGLSPDVAERAFVAADVHIAVRAEISTADVTMTAMTRDMSATGIFLACDTSLAQGDEIRISVLMPGEDDWILAEHELTGVIVRVDPDVGYGVRLTDVPDAYLTDVRALCEL